MNIVKSNESAVVYRDPTGDLDPRDFEGACELAKYVAATKLNGVVSPQDALTRILTGRELGWRAMASIRGIHIIEGKAVIAADAMHAICLQSKECERFECVENTDERVTYAVKKRGGVEHRVSWSIEDAKRAGLASRGTWAKFPRQMLHARCKSEAARLVFPERLFGIYTKEEIDHSAPASDVPRAVAASHAAPIVDAETIPIREDFLRKIEAAGPDDGQAVRLEIKRAVDLGYLTDEDRKVLQAAYAAKFPPARKTKNVVDAEVAPTAIEAEPVAETRAETVADIVDRGDDPDAY